MKEYALSVFAICAICGLLSLLCYGSGRAERSAVSIIAAFVIISPMVVAVKNIDLDTALDSLTGGSYETDADCSVVAEEAFAKGIRQVVADKFLLDREEIRVRIMDFNMEKMRAGQIKITLSGSAALADYRGIEEYVNGLGMGVCRVEIEIRKGLS